MSSIYVKQICAQLASNTTIEIRNHLDGDLLFEGAVAAIPPETSTFRDFRACQIPNAKQQVCNLR